MAKAVLKIAREGEVYRLTLHGEPSYDAVASAVADVWPGLLAAQGPEAATGPLEAAHALLGQVKYRDEDGDLCSLTPHTFDDFLQLHDSTGQGPRVLKLELPLAAKVAQVEPPPPPKPKPEPRAAVVAPPSKPELQAVPAAASVAEAAAEGAAAEGAAAAAAAAEGAAAEGAAASAAQLKDLPQGLLPAPDASPVQELEVTPPADEKAWQEAAPTDCSAPPPGLVWTWPWDGVSGEERKGWGGCCGPRRLLQVARALQRGGELTDAMLLSLALEGLPALTQRVARKVDKINHLARKGLEEPARGLLKSLAEAAGATPGMEAVAPMLEQELERQAGPFELGETVLKVLRTVGGLGFEAKVELTEKLAGQLLPWLDNLAQEIGIGWQAEHGLPALQHSGIVCNGCGASPLQGPRFTCTECAVYHLCGNCYPRKQELHKDCSGAARDFQCTLKGKGKGMGKGKGKGEWRGKGGGPPAHSEAIRQWWKGLGKGKAGFFAALAASGAPGCPCPGGADPATDEPASGPPGASDQEGAGGGTGAADRREGPAKGGMVASIAAPAEPPQEADAAKAGKESEGTGSGADGQCKGKGRWWKGLGKGKAALLAALAEHRQAAEESEGTGSEWYGHGRGKRSLWKGWGKGKAASPAAPAEPSQEADAAEAGRESEGPGSEAYGRCKGKGRWWKGLGKGKAALLAALAANEVPSSPPVGDSDPEQKTEGAEADDAGKGRLRESCAHLPKSAWWSWWKGLGKGKAAFWEAPAEGEAPGVEEQADGAAAADAGKGGKGRWWCKGRGKGYWGASGCRESQSAEQQ